MKIAITIALAMMTLATHAAVKKADVKKADTKKSSQQQKAEEQRADLRKKVEDNSKPKVAEEPTNQPQASKYFTGMRLGETAKIENESACVCEITGTNTATIIFAWTGSANQKAVLTGVPTKGLFNKMDIQIPYALTITGAQTYKTTKGGTGYLPIIRPATKEEAVKKGFAENEIHP